MGHCCSKGVNNDSITPIDHPKQPPSQPHPASTPRHPPPDSSSFTCSPFQSPLPAGVAPSPSPGRKFRWPLPPPSPAKPIMSAIKRRLGSGMQAPPKEGPTSGDGGVKATERQLDKNFGYGKNFGAKFELGKEVGRGHFGHTCCAKGKKGTLKGKVVAVKIISKAKVCLFEYSLTRDWWWQKKNYLLLLLLTSFV